MFTYNCRLFERYDRPVASLAVLADDSATWRPSAFGWELFGCRLILEYPLIKLLDYAPRLEALLQDPNPFALVTAAHLLTRETRGDAQRRYAAKWRLARLLYERDWDRQRPIVIKARSFRRHRLDDVPAPRSGKQALAGTHHPGVQ